jgi:hypothetical protein
VILVWENFGFLGSPYTTEPVPSTEQGDQLLVGREADIQKLRSRILAGGTHPTLEGDNGVGKTSLISVACYRLRRDFEQGTSDKLFLPIDDFFQPTTDGSVDDFIKKVYFAIASTIIKEYPTLKKNPGVKLPNVSEVGEWLNSPIFRSHSGSASAAGFGAGFGTGRSGNGSAGFAEEGFKDKIDGWLRQIFPTSQSGGFICVLDNIELLDTTQSARNLLEAIRDPLLGRRGLRWILCGARGIVRTSAASPRLDGRLSDPMEIAPISDGYVLAAIEQRIAAYRLRSDAEAPVKPESFRFLYDVLNRNLRNAFKMANDFCQWLVDEDEISGNATEYASLFNVWLTEQADKHQNDTRLGRRAWEVFDHLAERDGWCCLGDHEEFRFNSKDTMRPHIKALHQENLVFTSNNDDADKRRKTIFMTPRGWLVRYARAGYRV